MNKAWMKEQINIISRKKRQKTHDNSSLIRIVFFRFNKLREQFQLII